MTTSPPTAPPQGPARFLIERVGEHFHWVLLDARGERILFAATGATCLRALDAAEEARKAARISRLYERKNTRDDRPYFVLKGAVGEVLAIGPTCDTAHDRDLVLERVRSLAPGAQVVPPE